MTNKKQTRIEWACRRGMLELDLLLQPYAKKIYPNLPAEQQALFERLLDLDDPTLYQWLMGKETSSDPTLQTVVDHIRRSAHTLPL